MAGTVSVSFSKDTAQVNIAQFMGINQSQGQNLSMSYATDAENIDTRYGRIASAKGFTSYAPPLGAPIITLARFHRRFWPVESERDVLVAATATKIYTLVEGASEPSWVEAYTGTFSGSWSCVTYEDYRSKEDDPVDVLLMSNSIDGMVAVWGDLLNSAVPVPTPGKFGSIARYKERIFGTGDPDNPDRIWYSQPFDPTNWEPNLTIPADGSSFIDSPTWDGDSFIALQPYGSYLLAFKKNTVVLLSGDYPGEFMTHEGYGTDGPQAAGTIATASTAVFYLTNNGVGMYDGSTIRSLSRDVIRTIVDRLNASYVTSSIAAICNNVYYIAVPLDDSTVPNAIIEYDMERSTFMLRTGFTVGALMHEGGKLLLTTRENPDTVCIWGSGDSYNGVPINARWVSPWTDLGAKNIVKSSFMIRALVTGSDTEATSLKVTIETEKKVNSKTFPVPAKSETIKKMLLKTINNNGRLFRFILSSEYPFEIASGIQIETELDSD